MVNSCLWHIYSQCNVWHRLQLHTHTRARSKLYFTHTGTIKDQTTVFERLLLSLRTNIQNKKTCYCFHIWLKFYQLPHGGLGRRSVPPATNKTPVTYTIACHLKLPQLCKCVCMCLCPWLLRELLTDWWVPGCNRNGEQQAGHLLNPSPSLGPGASCMTH